LAAAAFAVTVSAIMAPATARVPPAGKYGMTSKIANWSSAVRQILRASFIAAATSSHAPAKGRQILAVDEYAVAALPVCTGVLAETRSKIRTFQFILSIQWRLENQRPTEFLTQPTTRPIILTYIK
jgi:hypothetical protein